MICIKTKKLITNQSENLHLDSVLEIEDVYFFFFYNRLSYHRKDVRSNEHYKIVISICHLHKNFMSKPVYLDDLLVW